MEGLKEAAVEKNEDGGAGIAPCLASKEAGEKGRLGDLASRARGGVLTFSKNPSSRSLLSPALKDSARGISVDSSMAAARSMVKARN